MLQVVHAFGSADAGFDYLQKLQANNLGPSSSTGRLAGLVNKGELYVANGDVQMNTSQMQQDPNLRIFFPAGRTANARLSRCPIMSGSCRVHLMRMPARS